MDIFVFFAVLLAAACHAGWNAVVKIGDDRLVALSIITLFSGLGGLAAIPVVGMPNANALPWLALSVLLHTLYRLLLARAYESGDLGQVYPLARGAAPLIVAFAGFFLLGEAIGWLRFWGVAVLCAGIALMAFRGGHLTAKLSPPAVGFALATSVSIAGYTLVDGVGARANETAHSYVAWLFFLDAIAIWAVAAVMRREQLAPALARHWKSGLGAGLMSALAYWIAIWAMTQAPIALVSALRETSVLFAALISALILREGMTPWRAFSAVVIVAGIMVIRLG